LQFHREGISDGLGRDASPLKLGAIVQISGFMKNRSFASVMSSAS
jgi:hypothetical protein